MASHPGCGGTLTNTGGTDHDRRTFAILDDARKHFLRRDELIAALLKALSEAGNGPLTCLVKGSRSLGMEAVVAAIVKQWGQGQDGEPPVREGMV